MAILLELTYETPCAASLAYVLPLICIHTCYTSSMTKANTPGPQRSYTCDHLVVRNV